MRITRILPLALLLSAAVGGCSPSTGAAPSGAAPSGAATSRAAGTPAGPISGALPATTASAGAAPGVTISTFSFSPAPLQVVGGTKVTWTNQDAIEHSVTHGTAAAPGGTFDSGFFIQGQTFAFTFDQAGAYPYFCRRHPSMNGTITVTARS